MAKSSSGIVHTKGGGSKPKTIKQAAATARSQGKNGYSKPTKKKLGSQVFIP